MASFADVQYGIYADSTLGRWVQNYADVINGWSLKRNDTKGG